MTTYSGKASLQINPGTLPDKWENFKLKSEEGGSDPEFILDLHDRFRRNFLNQSTGLYYLCVKGELTSTYTLLVREQSQDLNVSSEIKDGYSEYFFIRNNSMRLHFYRVPKLDYSYEDIKVEFTLSVRRGNTELILAARMCDQ